MDVGIGAPSVDELFGRLYAGGGLPALHGEGFGIDRSGDGYADGAFVFAHQRPDRWLLERPAGRLRAVGDSRGEVAQGRDEIVRRVGVGVGWAGELAAWLLRVPVTGTPLDELRRMTAIEPPAVDQVAGRRCWRFAFAGPMYVWGDAELPILLRMAGGGPEQATAQQWIEVTNLTVGSTGRAEPIWHPLLDETRPPVASTPAVIGLRRLLREAVPEARDIEVLEWAPEGQFQVQLKLDTPGGVATVLLDRRGVDAEPYERVRAGLLRDGEDSGWCLSLDHDPELGHEAARRLARRLSHVRFG